MLACAPTTPSLIVQVFHLTYGSVSPKPQELDLLQYLLKNLTLLPTPPPLLSTWRLPLTHKTKAVAIKADRWTEVAVAFEKKLAEIKATRALTGGHAVTSEV